MLKDDRYLLLIGQLAAQSGISIKTIRYYEQLGLIRASGRTEGGFRLFSPAAVNRLAFVKRAQHLGLSLREIGECLAVYDRGHLPCDEIKHQLETKVLEIDEKIEQLQMLKTELKQLLTTWKPVPERTDKICPILQKD